MSCKRFIVLWTLLETAKEVETIGIAASIVIVFRCRRDFVAYLGEIFGEILAR
jgi:hypothetical protein